MASHARSGGTLLARCFEDVDGGALVFNEPEIFVHLTSFGSKLDMDLFKRVFFCFCKTFWLTDELDSTQNIVIKIRPGYPWVLRHFLDLEEDMKPFLKMSFLINYRNPVDAMKSSIK